MKNLNQIESEILEKIKNIKDHNAYNLITKFHTYDHRVKKIINLYENRL